MKVVLSLLIPVILCAKAPPMNSNQPPLKLCDTNQCKGEYTIEIPQETHKTVEITEVKGTIREHKREVEIIIMKRRKLTTKCTSEMKPFTTGTCTELISIRNPIPSEIRSIEESKECPTGYECEPDGECYGDQQSRCDEDTITTRKGPIRLKWIGERYLKWFRDTCIMSWECNIVNAKVPVSMSFKNERATLYYTTEDGEIVEINDNLYDKGFTNREGYIHILKERYQEPSHEDIKLKCYSSDKSNIKCVLPEIGKDITDIPFSLNNKLEGIIRNYHVILTGEISIIEDGKIMKIKRVNNKIDGVIKEEKFNKQKSASIESVVETIESIQTLQLQEIYNSEINNINIKNSAKVIRHILLSLAKIDTNLLSRITDNFYMTKWINHEVFEKCPCIKEPKMGDSNCNERYYYSKGVYYSRNPEDLCITANNKDIVNMSLLNTLSIDETFLKNMPPQVSTRDSDAWVELNKMIAEKSEESFGGPITTHGDSRSNLDSVGKFNFELLTLNSFTTVTCISFWIVLLLKLVITIK